MQTIVNATFNILPVIATLGAKLIHTKGESDLSYLLTDLEKAIIRQLDDLYKSNFPERDPAHDEDLCYFLGDNPATYSPTWSGVSGSIPTFRLNNGYYWFPAAKRWLVPEEKLGCLTMPVWPEFADAMGVRPLGVRDFHRASLIAGNCMHFLNSTIVQLVALCCFGAKSPGPVLNRT